MSQYTLTDSESENQSNDDITVEVPENFHRESNQYYKKVVYPETQRTKSDLYIKKQTDVKKCIAYCIDLMYNKQYPFVKLSAVSQDMDKAVFLAELLKRKVKNLHQNNTLSTFVYHEIYTPKEPSEERFKFKIEKLSTCLTIQILRAQPKDTKTYGYQEPIQISLVSPRDPRDYIQYVLDQENQPKKKQQMNKMRDFNKKNYQNKNFNNSKQKYQKQKNFQKQYQQNHGNVPQYTNNYQQRNNNYHNKNTNQNRNNYQQKNYPNQKVEFNKYEKKPHFKNHYNNQKNSNYQQKQQNEYEKKPQKNESNQQFTQKSEQKQQDQQEKIPQNNSQHFYKNSQKYQKKQRGKKQNSKYPEFQYVKKQEVTETDLYVKKKE